MTDPTGDVPPHASTSSALEPRSTYPPRSHAVSTLNLPPYMLPASASFTMAAHSLSTLCGR